MAELTYVIPAFNAAQFIERAINSIFANSGPNAKIIVVDDGSTDSTPDVLARYGQKLLLLRQQNAGPSAARNYGLQAVETEIVCFVDADDYIVGPHRSSVEEQWKDSSDIIIGLAAEANGDVISLSKRNKYSPESDGGTLLRHFIRDNCVQTSTLCWSTKFLKKIGGWDEALFGVDDIELAMRAFLNDPEVTISDSPGWVVWQRHPGQTRGGGKGHRLAKSQVEMHKKILSLMESKQSDPATILMFHKRCASTARWLYLNGYTSEATDLFEMVRNKGHKAHHGPQFESILANVAGTKSTLSMRRKLTSLKSRLLREENSDSVI